MRFLKTLQLHGYKTFASKTEFVFDAGITAIVGPNGSGKSNIADGLRWVLGEQSYNTLRGKRTEDMIFSGSEQRARLGMAYVSLTLDNSTGWLPIDFSEVEIARRAYRSGENEYFINGNRVRLRDITELLGKSGLSERTYSIIGQGLIDQALSQRPEERRKLFEEAAGITVHQSKRDQARQKLEEARANLTRARDIINELTPRLRYLKGQARRATEYQQIKADLAAQLRIWYGYKWRQANLALAEAQQRLKAHVGIVEEQSAALSALQQQAAGRQAERASLRDQLGDWHRASSQLHRQAEAIQRELAVRSEQLRLWGQQQADLEEELVRLRAGLEDGAERLRSAEAALAAAAADHEAHAGRVADAQKQLDVLEAQRRTRAAQLAQAEDALLALRTQLAERRSRLDQLGDRRRELTAEQDEQARAIQAAQAELARLETQIAELEKKLAAIEADLAEIEQARQVQGQALAQAQEAERQAVGQLGAAQRALARLQDQQELLTRLRDEGAGLNAGGRAVLAAARGRSETGGAGPARSRTDAASLSGVIGALGELIEVPAELDRALEAALGSRMQDIVVRTWEDAEAAVAFLKQTQAGRATFLPLDSLRPGRPLEVPRAPGVLGLASELIGYDPAIRPAVELALNHVIVVRDLPTARRLLKTESRATFVTVEGEIVRPGGSITGGSEARGRDSGLLARARALRELPGQIEAAARLTARHEAEVAAARQAQETSRNALDRLRGRRDALAGEKQKLTAERDRLWLAGDRSRQTIAWHQERMRQIQQELAGLDQAETTLAQAIGELTTKLAAQEAAVEAARRGLAALAADDLLNELARLRAEAAVSAGQLRSHQARVTELQALQQQRRDELNAKEARLKALAELQAQATQEIAAYETQATALAAEIEAFAALINPAEARLVRLEQEQHEAEAQERDLREQLRQAQMRQSQAELAYQRRQDELAHLRAEIEKELGPVAFESDDLAGDQPPLPLNGVVTHLPEVVELPADLEESVRQLRGQLSRLGPVNLEALSEYNEVEARYNFLTTQAADLEKAVADLEQVIADLDAVMKREFMSTFKAVAAQFKEEFTSLFGGGSARLVLTDPDDPATTGVEIIARPPGKREQGLALLSGGERALTAAALIFSILKARPTPFCVLDEVDAALDEANVGRFREALKALSKQTQFILITHNRGTIEVADTIYGISMGADNTSQVLSLKLDGREVVPAGPAEIG